MEEEYVFEVQELADMTPGNARGSALAAPYALEPRIWIREIVDAAKKRMQHAQFAIQKDVPKGNKDIVIPRRKIYIGSGTTWHGDAIPGSDIEYTTIDVIDGQLLTPSEQNGAVAVTYDTIRTNLVDYITEAKSQLVYYAGDRTDISIVRSLISGTQSTSAARGLQKIYGGDATVGSEVDAGDVIVTDMVAECKRKLQSTTCKYWTPGTGEANSSQAKNPWMNEAGKPFVFTIAPEQEERFLKDSQFVNASEYGSDKIIHNGEIGDYLGVKIVVSNNTDGTASGAQILADSRTSVTDLHTCIMFKAKSAVAVAYGLRPRLHIFDYPRQLEKDIILEQAYATAAVQYDAIVSVTVADV